MEREILVPLDGSLAAEAVLPQALLMARATDSTLHLLRVTPAPDTHLPLWSTGMPFETQADRVAIHAAAQAYLDQIATALQAQEGAVCTTIMAGDPASTILAWATEHPAIRQIAMATHGRSGVTRWILGSVAEKVLPATPVPLLLVRASDHHAAGPPEATRPAPDLTIPGCRTIMVPLDGSVLAEQALVSAQVLAAFQHAELLLVSVIRFPDDPGLASAGVVPFWTLHEQQAAYTQATQYLETQAQQLRSHGVSVRIKLVEGDPAEALARTGIEEGADLTVMSTHGRSGVQRVWLGSVASKLVRQTTQPVLLVRGEAAAAQRSAL